MEPSHLKKTLEDSIASQLEFKWNKVLHALSTLSLKYVSFGDYIVVMNSCVDTIAGEPYLALQLWFSMNSGKVISRIWGQTVACEKVADISQFIQTCTTHFERRPCLGYPAKDEEQRLQDFFISNTPIPRKVSKTCQTVLDHDTDIRITSCTECLKLRDFAIEDKWDDSGRKSFNFEHILHTDEQNNGQLQEKNFPLEENQNQVSNNHIPCNNQNKYGVKYTVNCGYKTKKKMNLQVHCKQLSHDSPCLPCKTKRNKPKNEGMYECDNENSDFKTDHSLDLQDQCKKKSQQSSGLQQEGTERLNYTCESCGKCFAFRLTYERHRNQEHEIGVLHMKCHICENVLNCNVFAQHMKTQHGQIGKFLRKCDWCDEKLSTESLKEHAIRKHSYGKFLCKKCIFRGDFAKQLIDHIIQEHDKGISPQCPLCTKEYPLDVLESHYESCIKVKIRGRQVASDKCDQICETCGKTLTTKAGYRDHIKGHLREQASFQGGNLGNTHLYHYCDKCGKRFTHHNTLKNHIKSVHENIQYTCPLCPMKFNTIFMMRRHKLEAHSTNENYQCKYCGKRFGAITKRKLHERVHEDPKFKCRYCEKKLKSAKSLEAHERYHRGEKPFECSICGTGFTAIERLRQHISGAHKIAGPNGRKAGWRKSREKQK